MKIQFLIRYYSIFNSNQIKIGEIYIIVRLDPLTTSESTCVSDASCSSSLAPSRSASQTRDDLKSILKYDNKTYKKDDDIQTSSINDTATLVNNKILSTLIEKGKKLKEEMLKSTLNPLKTNTSYDTSLIANGLVSSDPELDDNMKLMSLLNGKSSKYLSASSGDEDLSDADNPLRDPDIIKHLFYSTQKDTPKSQVAPVRSRARSKSPKRSTSISSSRSHSATKRNRRASVCSVESEISDISRVSFDMPSSDCETIDANKIDGLCVERLTLLGRVNIARVNIDKMYLILNTQSIIDNLNKRVINREADKPPRSSSSQDSSSQITYFVEYQFPVLANSRDEVSNIMATEVMRVASKRVSSGDVYFTHRATFPVLFNGSSLESWWKSILIFKVYSRLPGMKAPALIGTVDVPLKQILKAESFKYEREARIIDRYYAKLPQKKFKGAIGKLYFSIDLTSDSVGFNEDFEKLKFIEAKNPKLVPIVVAKKPSSSLSTINTNNSSNIIQHQVINETLKSHETQVQLYLDIQSGRYFDCIKVSTQRSNREESGVKNIYLNCRLFWCDEQVKSNIAWGASTTPTFHLKENLILLLNDTVLKRMHNNFMIVEVWNKSLTQNTNDTLIGIVKLPLNQFYVSFKDEKLMRLFFEKSRHPCVGVDNWIPVIDPFSGQKTGELCVIFAMGTNEQILNFQSHKIESTSALNSSISDNRLQTIDKFLIEHLFEVKIDGIKGLKLFDEMIWGETDCFIQYHFPENSDAILTLKAYRTSTTLCIPDPTFNESIKHRIRLNKNASIQREFLNTFSGVSGGVGSVPFEIWLRYYYPNVRDQIIAKGDLQLSKVCGLFTSDHIITQNYEIPLYNVTPINKTQTTQSCGKLGLSISYKSSPIKNDISNYLERVSSGQVVLNVGIIRACGLKACAKYLARTESQMQYPSEVGVHVYGKVFLSFLKQDEFRQTRTLARTFTPEFFHYFDFPCPILWTDTSTDSLSLAEILETSEIKIELWHQVTTSQAPGEAAKDILLGTSCITLKQLLMKQTGIKGWLPVLSPSVGWQIKAHELNLNEELFRINGGLEIVVRFAQQDDRNRVIEAAKSVGWIRNDIAFDLPLDNDSNTNYLFHIGVEKLQFPMHLALKLGSKQLDPNTRCFIRFKFFDREPVVTKCRQLERSVDESFLKCSFKFTKEHLLYRTASLLWYLNEEKLEVQVWITTDDDLDKKEPSERDKMIGSVFVNMESFNDQTRKEHRISGLYQIFKAGCKELNGAFCQVHLSLEKLDDVTNRKLPYEPDIEVRSKRKEEFKKQETRKSDGSTFSCIIGIERASHLTNVYDRTFNKHIPPNAYVTYSPDNTSRLVKTQVIERNVSPIWNYQELTQFSCDHLFDESKCLILKVWHKLNPDLESASPEKSGDKVLGFVSIDLSPLMSGLSQISGWYNIIDMVGQCQGQLKVNICPQDNLLDLKKRAMNKTIKSSTKSNGSLLCSKTESFYNREPFMILPISKDNPNESCILKTNLRKQLEELDKINENLKAKLTTKPSTSNIIQHIPEALPEPVISPPLTKVEETKSHQSDIQKFIDEHTKNMANALNVIAKANTLIQSSSYEDQVSLQTQLPPPIHPNSVLKSKSKTSFLTENGDSFWTTPINSDDSDNEENCNKNITNQVNFIESVEVINQENHEIVEDEQNDNHMDETRPLDDTDLDQTNNLSSYLHENRLNLVQNESFDDKLPPRGPSPSLETNDENHLQQEDEEEENQDDTQIEIIEIKPLNSVSGMNFDFNHHQIELKDHFEGIKEEEKQESKIDNEVEKSIDETIITKKHNFEFLNKPLPNFFLPPEDLEQSMRRLHVNFKLVS